MQLAAVPESHEPLIVIGTSVRKPLPVLQAFLESLAWQELPPRAKVHYVFVPDFSGHHGNAENYLREWVKSHDGDLLRPGPSSTEDFSDVHPVTHQWTGTAMRRVGENKNRILRKALELKADAIWLADADLIMDRT